MHRASLRARRRNPVVHMMGAKTSTQEVYKRNKRIEPTSLGNTGRAVVDVVTEVERAAAARPAGGLVQVLHAQALGLDELEQVGPLALLDAAEQVVLRGRQDAALSRPAENSRAHDKLANIIAFLPSSVQAWQSSEALHYMSVHHARWCLHALGQGMRLPQG